MTRRKWLALALAGAGWFWFAYQYEGKVRAMFHPMAPKVTAK
jgi:hypothetical protein